MKKAIYSLLLVSLMLGVAVPLSELNAQMSQAEKDAQRVLLERELAAIEREIQAQNALLNEKKGEVRSIQRDRAVLAAEIKKAQLTIRAKALSIGELSGEIGQKEQSITQYAEKIERERSSLAEIIRKRNQIDDYSLVEMVLGNKNLSEFFSDVDRFEDLKIQLRASMNEIREIKGVTEAEKIALDERRRAEADAKATIEGEKKTVEVKEAEKRRLEAIAQGEAGEYEKIVKEKERKAADIRARLFALRDAGAIPFGDAYSFAKAAGASTGVRPALILAILQQESNMGQNVGTCNRPGDALKWQDIMPGPGESWRDDQSAYLRIMSALGMEPEGQPLSCPIGGGWGGAMGPSQFIPTTWEAYAPRIGSIVGVSTPSPWNPRHAVTATAVYLGDLGAGAKTYSAERSAACKYYSGRDCGLSSMDNTFYGDSVVQRANTIQTTMIDPLEDV